jgi:hypothetical protein
MVEKLYVTYNQVRFFFVCVAMGTVEAVLQ